MPPALYAPNPWGTEDDEDSARECLAAAVAFWIDSAGLTLCRP